MHGHPRPHRAPIGSTPLSHRRRPLLLSLLTLFLLATMLTGGALLTACGSDEPSAETVATTSVTEPPTTTEAAPTTTTEAAVEEGTETGAATFPVTVTDDLGNSVTIESQPLRIVSTAPANTELLFALGLGDRVVGVTSLDDYPPEVADVAKVGDFQVNTEAVMALNPDLVVGYSGNEEALAPVQEAGAAVLILNPIDLEGIYANITTVGEATGATAEATDLIASIQAEIAEVTETASAVTESPKVFYALDNTLWTAGPGSFVDELLALVNATNVGVMQGDDNTAAQAYFQFAPEQLLAADPDVVLLPNTAYTSVDEFMSDARFAGLRAVQEGNVVLIDDVVVTRPGPRIGLGLRTLAEAVHPDAF